MTTIREQLKQEDSFDFSEGLKAIEEQFSKEFETGRPSEQTQFAYACYLIKSHDPLNKQKGIAYMQELLEKDPNNREYLYFLAIGCYQLEEYGQSRAYVTHLLEIEPTNRQAKELQDMIHNKIKSDGFMGMAIAAGGAVTIAATGILLAALLKRK